MIALSCKFIFISATSSEHPIPGGSHAHIYPADGSATGIIPLAGAEETSEAVAAAAFVGNREALDGIWEEQSGNGDATVHMTNDSHLFRTKAELEDSEGAWPIGGNRWQAAAGEWVPLYVGRMIHQFDHRAASVTVNGDNIHNAALSGEVTAEMKANPAFVPDPQFWVRASDCKGLNGAQYAVAFRDIARATDARTFICTVAPGYGLAIEVLASGKKRCRCRRQSPAHRHGHASQAYISRADHRWRA